MWGFTPKWVRMLPEHLRPDSAKIKALEDLKKGYGFPDEMLAAGILNSEKSALRNQHFMLKQLRAQIPNASEKELWKGVLVTRAGSAMVAGASLEVLDHPGTRPVPMDEQEIDRIVEKAKNFEDICQAIINHERSQRMPDLSGIQDEIDALLAEEAEGRVEIAKQAAPGDASRFVIVTCGKCHAKLPVPKGGGVLTITCPDCSREARIDTGDTGRSLAREEDVERAKALQRKLYTAAGRGWTDNDFDQDWIYKPFGTDWDHWYKLGLVPVKFCALCGSDDWREDSFIKGAS